MLHSGPPRLINPHRHTTTHPLHCPSYQTPLAFNELSKLVQPWYAKFVEIDRELLFDLVAAANYMHIKPLLDLSCLAVSIMIKGKSAHELRTIFNIQADLTDEERAQIDRENAWVTETNNNAGANGNNPDNADPVPPTEDSV